MPKASTVQGGEGNYYPSLLGCCHHCLYHFTHLCLCDIVRTCFDSPGPTVKDRGMHNGFRTEVKKWARTGFWETRDKDVIKGIDTDSVIFLVPRSLKGHSLILVSYWLGLWNSWMISSVALQKPCVVEDNNPDTIRGHQAFITESSF